MATNFSAATHLSALARRPAIETLIALRIKLTAFLRAITTAESLQEAILRTAPRAATGSASPASALGVQTLGDHDGALTLLLGIDLNSYQVPQADLRHGPAESFRVRACVSLYGFERAMPQRSLTTETFGVPSEVTFRVPDGKLRCNRRRSPSWA